MMDPWTGRLSEYLDGELPEQERSALASHLETCDACATTLAELRAVVERAGTLPDRPPERDLWPGIAARLAPRDASAGAGALDLGVARARRAGRRLSFTVPQLIAAGVTLMVLSAGTVWAVLGGGEPVATGLEAEAAGAMPVQFAGYEQTVRALERELEQRRALLDPATVAVVEENLRIIDGAIREARAALAEDPSSAYLTTHLAQTMRRKVELLQRAATLAGT